MTDLEKEFTRLVSEYKSMIYSVCMMFADSKDETDDLVQEALLHLWQGFKLWRMCARHGSGVLQ